MVLFSTALHELIYLIHYKQMIRPLLEYCYFLFNGYKKMKIDQIDRRQLKCLHNIGCCFEKDKRDDENDLCSKYDISPLQYQSDIQLGSIIYRYNRIDSFLVHDI